MTKEERREYMKAYNQTGTAKAAKKAWRVSKKGKEYHSLYHREYMSNLNNKERKRVKQKINRATSVARQKVVSSYNAEYCRRLEVKAKKNQARSARRKTDIGYRLTERIRGRIKAILKSNKPEATSKSLGCTAKELINHLERLFSPGMTWDNYGFYGWHVDHIKPLVSFDLTDLDQYRSACHYTNLQPMWATDNLSKGSRV